MGNMGKQIKSSYIVYIFRRQIEGQEIWKGKVDNIFFHLGYKAELIIF